MTLQDAYATLKVDKKKRTVVLKELQKLNLEKITAGIHAADGNQVVSDSGFKLIDVAVQNEFGNSWTLQKTARFFKNGKWWAIKKGTTINIPATRFVSRIMEDPNERRGVIEEFKTCLYILLKYGKVGEGYTVRDLVKDVGFWMRDRIRAGIDEKMFEPNAPMTIAIKGFDQRLFEKGTLYNAIKYRSKKAKVEG
jgi:hypothetical protein